MTEQTPDTDPQLGDDSTPQDSTEAATPTPAGRGARLPEAPEDTPEDAATGYAVYDRTLARYVGPVTTDKPTRAEARKLAGEHPHRIVRV